MKGYFSTRRIHTIMKSSADVDMVSKESTYVITRAAELFIKLLAKEAYADSNKRKLDYKNIANVVNSKNRYDFLREMIPHKITVEEYYKIIKKKSIHEAGDAESEESSSNESSSEEEEDTNTKEAQNISSSSDSEVIVLD